MKLLRKEMFLIAGILLVQLSVGGALFVLHERIEDDVRRIEHSQRVGLTVSNILAGLMQGRREVARETFESTSLDRTISKMQSAAGELKYIVRDQPERLASVNRMYAHILTGRNMIEVNRRRIAGLMPPTGREHDLWEPIVREMTGVTEETDAMSKMLREEEAISEKALAQEEAERHMDVTVTVVATALEILIAAVLISTFSRQLHSRLDALLENTKRISTELPMLPLPSGDSDEIVSLDRMIRKISAAVDKAIKEDRDLVDKQVDVIVQLSDLPMLRIKSANRVGRAKFGLDGVERGAHSLLEFVNADDAERVKAEFQTALEQGSCQFEASLIDKEKGTRQSLWFVRWSAYDHAFLCFAHDITEHKQAEKLRQEVLQMVGHDLKSPLTTVGGFLQLFETGVLGELSPDGLRLVESSLARAKQMNAVVRDLLNLEMIRAGMFDLQLEKCVMDDLLKTALGNSVQETGLEFKPTLGRAELLLDKERILTVIDMLVTHALGRSPDYVELQSERSANRALVIISDRGEVIPRHELSRVFEPFGSASSSRSSLTLAFCRAIVELHSGQLSVLSEPSTGTRFTMDLPLMPQT